SAEISATRESISERKGELQTEDAKHKLWQQAVAVARKALSPDWQDQADSAAPAEINRLRGEKENLEREDAEAGADELQNPLIDIEALKQALADLERERDQFPAQARRDPAHVQLELAEARKLHAEKTEQLNAARGERAELDRRARQRRDVAAQLAEADREL